MVQKPTDKLEHKQAEAAKKKAANRPKGVKVPLDHQSAKADVKDGKHVTVEFRGQEYTTVLTGEEVGRNLDLMEMLSEGNIVPPMKQILGPAQWVRFKNDFRDPETGIVDSQIAGDLYEELMTALKLKNS